MQGVVRLLQGVVRLLPFKPVALIALGARSRTTNHSTPLPQETLYRCLLLNTLPVPAFVCFVLCCVFRSAPGRSRERVCHARRSRGIPVARLPALSTQARRADATSKASAPWKVRSRRRLHLEA